jgi:PAS domain-containing protein
MTEHQEHSQSNAQNDPALKIIMDASPAGIVAFGSDARIVYANPLAEQLFGKSTPEDLGIKCGDFIGCANRHMDLQGCGHTKRCPACPLFCAIGGALSGESNTGNLEGECLLECDSGLSAIWVKYKVGTVMMEGATVAIMTIDDITGRKQHEEKLRNALRPRKWNLSVDWLEVSPTITTTCCL